MTPIALSNRGFNRSCRRASAAGGRKVEKLTSLRLAGWKSIRDAKVEFRPLSVLIGANGAGKSNLVSLFKLMDEMMDRRLQVHVGTTGGAESLLHYGSKRTPAVEAEFRYAIDPDQREYSFRLIPVVGNTLIFDEEKITFFPPGPPVPEVFMSRRGHRESELELYRPDNARADFGHNGAFIRSQVFHFHDTSLLGPMRRDCPVDANRYLYPDAANLPAMLYLYRERYPTGYRRILAAVKAVAPFFEDFVLEPLRLNPRNIALHWRAKGSEYDFGPHQLSDGTLRAIALFTLLLQPEGDLPELIILDEPELGLHPAALTILADLVKLAARHSQVLIATQSCAADRSFRGGRHYHCQPSRWLFDVRAAGCRPAEGMVGGLYGQRIVGAKRDRRGAVLMVRAASTSKARRSRVMLREPCWLTWRVSACRGWGRRRRFGLVEGGTSA